MFTRQAWRGALTGEAGMLLFPREWLGPVTLAAEVLVPTSRPRAPRDATALEPPAFMVSLSVNPLGLAFPVLLR